jgi:hypothetical protein
MTFATINPSHCTLLKKQAH